MSVVHALMGLLARGKRYGYQLRKELEDEFGDGWRLDFGQLYRVLASMQGKGWVGVRREPSPRGPDRKVYTLTRRGRAEFKRWLAQPASAVVRGRDEFPLKLRFRIAARSASPRELLAERRRLLESQRCSDRRQSDDARGRQDVGRWLLAETRQRQAEGALNALESYEAVIGSRRRASRAPDAPDTLLALGSDDLVLDLLARQLAETHPQIRFSATPVGSLAGLVALSEGRAQLAGIHLLDVDSGEYNVPFVKHLMPEESVVLLHLACREQGLMVAAGNPKNIRQLRDLARPGIQLVNRQRGAGTRLLLFHHLRKAGMDPHAICGYERQAPTHSAVAAAIAAGKADVGPGIRAAAEAWGLEFLPLGQERYDLAVSRPVFESRRFLPLLKVIHQDAFRRAAAACSGYDVTHMSDIVVVH